MASRIQPGSAALWIHGLRPTLRAGQCCAPVHNFYVQGFYIDRYEVSNAKYKTFIDAGVYTTEAWWNPVGWVWRVANNITLPVNWNAVRVAGNEGQAAGRSPYSSVRVPSLRFDTLQFSAT